MRSHAVNDPHDPDEAESLSIVLEWRSQISGYAGEAPAGPLKNTLEKYIKDLNAVISFFQANPNLNMSDQPARLTALEDVFTTDGEMTRAACSG